jgi:hypothetical protein
MVILARICSRGYIVTNKFRGIVLLTALSLTSCLSIGNSQPVKVVGFSSDELTVVNRLFATVNKDSGVILIQKRLYTLSPSEEN